MFLYSLCRELAKKPPPDYQASIPKQQKKPKQKTKTKKQNKTTKKQYKVAI